MTPIIGSSDLSPQPARSSVNTLGAPLFVWGVWAMMMMAALSFVVKYGSNLPAGDEWGYVPYMTGEKPVTAELLWAQHNEHRIPLPKALSLVLSRVTHCDYRAGMMFNLIALGALAFAMIRVGTRLRGSTSYTDAFFPLALLQLGQYENLMWSFQIAFVTSVTLASVFLLIIVQHPTRLGLRSSVLAGTCILLLPLCGAQGLALVPSLVLWLGSAALLHLVSGRTHDKRPSLLMLTFSVISLLTIALYFRGYNQPSYPPACPSLRAGLRTALEFMTVGFGPSIALFWPHAGWAMLGLLVSSGGLLMVAWWKHPQEWFRVLGLLAFLGAMASLSLAIGRGRSGLGPGWGFASHYVTLAVPLLCCVYFIWEIYGGWTLRHFGQMALFAIMCALLTPSTISALDDAKARRRIVKAMAQDLREGVPISVFIDRYDGWNFIFPPPITKDLARQCLITLHRANVGQFRYLRLDSPPCELSVPVVPIERDQMTWEEGVGRGTGVDPNLVFALKRPMYVYGIKLKYVVQHSKQRASLRAFWKRSARNEFSVAERNILVNVETGKENTTMIPVNDTIDRYRIDLEDPTSAIQISEIELLLPPPALARRG